jgi:hypothetical protein
MIETLLENPWVVGGVGLFLVVITIYGWVQTGQKGALYVAGGLFVATILAIFASVLIETRSEQLRKRIHSIAADLEANRFDDIVASIHPEATETVNRARAELPNYKFSLAKVTGIREMVFSDTVEPKRVTVKMTVVVEVETAGFSGRVPRLVDVTFYEDGGRWKVYDYSHQSPISGYREEGEFPSP